MLFISQHQNLIFSCRGLWETLEKNVWVWFFFPFFHSRLFLQNTGPNFHHDQDVQITFAVGLAFLAGMLHCPCSARKVEVPLILCSVEYRICLSVWWFPNSLVWRICLWKNWLTCLFSFPQSNDYPTRLNYPCALFYMLFVSSSRIMSTEYSLGRTLQNFYFTAL